MRPSKVKLLGVAVLLFHNFVIFTAVEHKSVVGKHFFTECRPNVALIRGFYIHAVNILVIKPPAVIPRIYRLVRPFDAV